MIYQTITIWDYIVLPFYIIIFFLIARGIKNNLKKDNIFFYSFFIKGLFAKIIGGLGLCFIYTYYYTDGGDTIAYFNTARILPFIFFENPFSYFSILIGNLDYNNFVILGEDVKFIEFTNDANSFTVPRLTSLLTPLGAFQYLPTTIILASISYIGIWKLFKLFLREFPEITKNIAIAILFVPSVLFWGSGIAKDTYTLSATSWMIYSFYMVFIYKEKIFPNVIAIIIMSYILFSIRPFMLYIGYISIILMLTHGYISSVKSAFIRVLTLIVILVVFWGGGIGLLVSVGSAGGGTYSTLDGMLEKAAVTQQDLSRSVYGENSFDIGAFEPTMAGILGKAPIAINAGLYYPYIWKANNPVMLLAGIENLIILLLSFYVLILIIVAIFKIGPKKMFKNLFDHPLIIFCLSYSIPFAFMVGLTTANYGALVRYKIPLVPFFLVSLFIIIHKFNRSQVEEKKDSNFIFKTK